MQRSEKRIWSRNRIAGGAVLMLASLYLLYAFSAMVILAVGRPVAALSGYGAGYGVAFGAIPLYEARCTKTSAMADYMLHDQIAAENYRAFLDGGYCSLLEQESREAADEAEVKDCRARLRCAHCSHDYVMRQCRVSENDIEGQYWGKDRFSQAFTRVGLSAEEGFSKGKRENADVVVNELNSSTGFRFILLGIYAFVLACAAAVVGVATKSIAKRTVAFWSS